MSRGTQLFGLITQWKCTQAHFYLNSGKEAEGNYSTAKTEVSNLWLLSHSNILSPMSQNRSALIWHRKKKNQVSFCYLFIFHLFLNIKTRTGACPSLSLSLPFLFLNQETDPFPKEKLKRLNISDSTRDVMLIRPLQEPSISQSIDQSSRGFAIRKYQHQRYSLWVFSNKL